VTRAVALLAVLALAGCGTGGLAEESASDGGTLFKQKCGGCHELAAAGTKGNIGPSLDAAFGAPRDEGFEESTIEEVVLGQMRYPIRPMPPPDELFPLKGGYTEADRDADMSAIAKYVASVAADERAIAEAKSQAGGGGGANDPKTIFTGNCGGCHTLAAAGTSGTVGPNLDAISPPLARVVEQIHKGGGGMPPFEGTLTEAQITALAKWVVANRGK